MPLPTGCLGSWTCHATDPRPDVDLGDVRLIVHLTDKESIRGSPSPAARRRAHLEGSPTRGDGTNQLLIIPDLAVVHQARLG
jgi:hypothetical protein